MRLLVTLALRNLLRHKRRTLLTAAALVFGIAIMILGRAWSAATGPDGRSPSLWRKTITPAASPASSRSCTAAMSAKHEPHS